jgi:hypothetical protein
MSFTDSLVFSLEPALSPLFLLALVLVVCLFVARRRRLN